MMIVTKLQVTVNEPKKKDPYNLIDAKMSQRMDWANSKLRRTR
jgi:hypothetical protein